MPEQEPLFKDDELDPAIAKVADRFIELAEQRKTVKDQYEIQERNLMGMLKKAGLKKVRHAGVLIEINHKDESENLKIKIDKAVKTGRRHPVPGPGEKSKALPRKPRKGKPKK